MYAHEGLSRTEEKNKKSFCKFSWFSKLKNFFFPFIFPIRHHAKKVSFSFWVFNSFSFFPPINEQKIVLPGKKEQWLIIVI